MSEFTDRWWETIIAGVAYETSRKPRFRGLVGHDEIQSALWEWKLAADKPRKATERNPDGLSRIEQYEARNEPEDFEKLIATILRNEAVAHARKERAAQFGYSIEDEYHYSLPSLENLLEQMFDREAWLHNPSGGDASGVRSSGAANEGGNWLATLADVSRAFSKLSKDDQNLLEVAYRKGGLSRADIARGMGLPRQTVDSRVAAAVKRLWYGLGGPRWARQDEDEPDKECVGSRKVISNAAARAISDRQYGDRTPLYGGTPGYRAWEQ